MHQAKVGARLVQAQPPRSPLPARVAARPSREILPTPAASNRLQHVRIGPTTRMRLRESPVHVSTLPRSMRIRH